MLGFEMTFLRPAWFFALIPVAWLLWKAWQVKSKQGAWQQVIAPEFRELLLNRVQSTSRFGAHLWLGGLGLAWFMTVFVLAGPSVKSVEIPAQKAQHGTVIVLDLSLSMLAEDLSPNRLSQVRFKLTDLLTQFPEMPAGLVVYAASAHTITPISQDNQTLLGLLPALDPLIMPAFGANPIAGFEQAKTLFEGAQITQGQIIWITDDVESEQLPLIENWFSAHPFRLKILSVGTEQGGTIPVPNYGILKDANQKPILAPVPNQRLAELSQRLQAPLKPLKITHESLDWLVPGPFSVGQSPQDVTEKSVVYPLDEGAAILLLLVPLLALAYRRGLVFMWLLAPMFVIGLSHPKPALAEDRWDDLANVFQSHDQQAYKAFKRENYESAEAMFEHPQWQAASLYRLGRYAEAARLYAQDPSAEGQFNLGNALAYSGDLQGAKTAYTQALKLRPNWPQAQANLALIEQLLAQQPPAPETPSEPTAGDSNQATQSAANSAQQTENSNDEQKQKASEQQENQTSQNAETQGNSESPSSTKQNEASAQNNAEQNQNQNSQNGANRDNNQSVQGEQSQEGQQAGNQQQGSQTSQGGGSASRQNERSMGDNAQSQQNTQEATQAEANSPDPTDPQQTSERGEQSSQQTGVSRLNEDEGQGSADGQNWENLQATEAWLQQIPDQPELFLKRKFEYQLNQGQFSQQQAEKTW
ncbi:MAG: VWA domain-containing protein [Thiotrichales bacterium]|nr:VWA domain-containing protein [Thiotrichales bacterium]